MPRPKHMTAKEAQILDALLDDPVFLRALARRVGTVKRSCRRPGEYKPGGGRYEKKTCVPRRKPRKKCHRAGQFKPGGGRYVSTPCRVKRRRKG